MKRLLLTTIFKPYGIKDRFAEATGMQMELFNNQITREQSVHSPRANYMTFALYFLAENISIPTTVLDNCSWNEFVRELAQGYSHIGISFIQPNILKVQRMTRFIRKYYPSMKIILGGYGVSIPEIDNYVSYDEICLGEGIRWLQSYFGDRTDQPIKHPIMNGVTQKYIYGYKDIIDDSGILFPGLGCENHCFFCSTSSKFNKYIPFLPTGKSVFQVCREAEKKLDVIGFAIIDENFFNSPMRARDLLAEMERHKKPYHFSLFASASTIVTLGIDFLVRFGVSLIWIGVETKRQIFDKVQDIDIQSLVNSLQEHGISVITSSILFLKHHTKEVLEDDIDWAISLGSDFHQFMQLIPFPGTPLYAYYKQKGLLISGFPYQKLHGQDELSFYHSHFKHNEVNEITRQAFRKKYHIHGPGILNMAKTSLQGYLKLLSDNTKREREHLAWNSRKLCYESDLTRHGSDTFMLNRIEQLRDRALEFRPILLCAQIFAPNRKNRKKAKEIKRLYINTFGRPPVIEKIKQIGLVLFATCEWLRINYLRFIGKYDLIRQPPTLRSTYNHDIVTESSEEKELITSHDSQHV